MTGSKGVKTNSEPRNRDRRPKKTGWYKHTTHHRGLHARSVHANSISRHYWVMVRRVFCLCCRDDMKIETSCPFSKHGICASNILFRGSWSSDDGPDLTTPVECRVPASGEKPSLRPRPRPSPKPPRCLLLVVRRRLSGGLFSFPLPRRQSTPTPQDDLRDCSNCTAKHPDNWDCRDTLVQNCFCSLTAFRDLAAASSADHIHC